MLSGVFRYPTLTLGGIQSGKSGVAKPHSLLNCCNGACKVLTAKRAFVL